MKSEHMKDTSVGVLTPKFRRTVPMVFVYGAITAGLVFGGQRANGQETSIATETTIIATETSLAPNAEVLTAESTLVASADTAVDDSTPAGGLETGFGGTASGSDSDNTGLITAAAGFTLLSAVAIRKLTKRSSAQAER